MKNKLKKLFALMLCFMTFCSLFTGITAFASDEISVYLNATKLQFDVPPQIINGRTMVPMRTIFEALGATVEWDSSTKSITATRSGNKINMTVGNAAISVNGTLSVLDVAPLIVDGRTLVPIRAISEAFSLEVTWNGHSSTIFINTPKTNTAYEILKDYIISNGEYGRIKGVYSLFTQNGVLFTYSIYDEEITMLTTFSSKKDNSRFTTMLDLTPKEIPSLFCTFEMDDGYEVSLLGQFSGKNNTLIELRNEFGSSSMEEVYWFINDDLEEFDNALYNITTLSLSDFKVSYNKN